jgi:2-keto-3-deoxy-L-fuconate dehydrogenase
VTARRVLITGASSGIGRSTARRFKELGATVAGLDLDGAGLAEPWIDVAVPCDVSDEESVRIGVEGAVEQLGGLDVLVCAAGVIGRGAVDELTTAAWDRIFGINVRGVFLCCRQAVPHLRRSETASIVTISSQWGRVAEPGIAAYCATKGAVESLTRAMAIDYAGDGITVNAVCPGPTDTPMSVEAFASAADPAAARAALAAAIPTGRFITPEEIAAAIAYLASPDARSTTGASLVVDGGFVAR